MNHIYLGQLGHPVVEYNPKKLLDSIEEFIEVETAKDPESAHERVGVISLLQIIFHIMTYQGYCGVDTTDLVESSIDEAHRVFAKNQRNSGAIGNLFDRIREELVILGSRRELLLYFNLGDTTNPSLVPLNLYEALDPINMMPILYEIVTKNDLESIYISYNKVS